MRKLYILLFTFLCFFGYSQEQFNSVKIQQPQTITYKIVTFPHIIRYDSILIDTLVLNNLLIQNNLYDYFKNGEWDKIDKVKFKKCLQLSRVKKVKANTESTGKSDEKQVIKYVPPPISSPIHKNINKVMLSKPIEQPQTTVQEITTVEQPKADLTYVINDTMLIGKPYTVDLTLSRNISNSELINIIDGFKNKQLIDTSINITPIMRARLLDASQTNFKITPMTDDIQNTTGNKLIRWQWQVVPLVEGENFLTISVDNYVDNRAQSVNIYNGKTYVYAIHTWYGDLWLWIKTNWTYITYVVGGIFAILAFLYKENIISIFKKQNN
jgi:hypothetical protein